MQATAKALTGQLGARDAIEGNLAYLKANPTGVFPVVHAYRALVARWPVVKFMHGYAGTCIGGQKRHGFPTARPCDRRFGRRVSRCTAHGTAASSIRSRSCGITNGHANSTTFSLGIERS